MRFYRKAVSPLIATVLLVMIVVSIGAAVMVVIQRLANDQIQSTERYENLIKCANDVKVNVEKQANNMPMICIGNYSEPDTTAYVKLYIANDGWRDISGWRFTVIGLKGIYDTTEYGDALPQGAIDTFGFPYMTNVTGGGLENISRIRLSPRIPGSGGTQTVTCSEPNFEWDYNDIADWYNCSNVRWADSIPIS